MPVLSIRLYGDPVLKEVAQPIEKIEPRHEQLARDMAETMYTANGIGLAANQIGSLERIIVVDVDWARAEEGEKPDQKPMVLINPEILEESVEDDTYKEGCLSIPGLEGDVWRPDRIKLKYQKLDGRPYQMSCNGLLARCIQHEIDHLNGVLFIDRMSPEKRRGLNRKLAKLAEEQGAAR